MGRGNTCVRGKYEGLYYVDRDFLDVYYNSEEDESRLLGEIDNMNGWEYDSLLSDINFEDFVNDFSEDVKKMFPSFEVVQLGYCGTIMKNSLFEIVLEDNEWSYAVKLIQVEADWDEPCKDGLQKKHYQNYLNGIKKCLFKQFDELGIYNGPWTHGTIYKEEEDVA